MKIWDLIGRLILLIFGILIGLGYFFLKRMPTNFDLFITIILGINILMPNPETE
jgi:hypothetical protein